MKKNGLICSVSVLILGCAETLQAPALHDFGVSNDWTEQRLQPTVSPKIKVIAPKWLNDDRLHYRLLYEQPTRVRFYNLDQWLAPPPELLKLQFASVRFDPNYSLVIHLQNFEQQFEAPGRASVLLRFSAEVFVSGSKNTLNAQEFVLRSGKISPDAQGAVKGFAELAGQAVQQIQTWLQQLKP